MRAREVNRKILRTGGQMVRQTGSHRRFAVEYDLPDGTNRQGDDHGSTASGRHPNRHLVGD
jgi:hypothetical protein